MKKINKLKMFGVLAIAISFAPIAMSTSCKKIDDKKPVTPPTPGKEKTDKELIDEEVLKVKLSIKGLEETKYNTKFADEINKTDIVLNGYDTAKYTSTIEEFKTSKDEGKITVKYTLKLTKDNKIVSKQMTHEFKNFKVAATTPVVKTDKELIDEEVLKVKLSIKGLEESKYNTKFADEINKTDIVLNGYDTAKYTSTIEEFKTSKDEGKITVKYTLKLTKDNKIVSKQMTHEFKNFKIITEEDLINDEFAKVTYSIDKLEESAYPTKKASEITKAMLLFDGYEKTKYEVIVVNFVTDDSLGTINFTYQLKLTAKPTVLSLTKNVVLTKFKIDTTIVKSAEDTEVEKITVSILGINVVDYPKHVPDEFEFDSSVELNGYDKSKYLASVEKITSDRFEGTLSVTVKITNQADTTKVSKLRTILVNGFQKNTKTEKQIADEEVMKLKFIINGVEEKDYKDTLPEDIDKLQIQLINYLSERFDAEITTFSADNKIGKITFNVKLTSKYDNKIMSRERTIEINGLKTSTKTAKELIDEEAKKATLKIKTYEEADYPNISLIDLNNYDVSVININSTKYYGTITHFKRDVELGKLTVKFKLSLLVPSATPLESEEITKEITTFKRVNIQEEIDKEIDKIKIIEISGIEKANYPKHLASSITKDKVKPNTGVINQNLYYAIVDEVNADDEAGKLTVKFHLKFLNGLTIISKTNTMVLDNFKKKTQKELIDEELAKVKVAIKGIPTTEYKNKQASEIKEDQLEFTGFNTERYEVKVENFKTDNRTSKVTFDYYLQTKATPVTISAKKFGFEITGFKVLTEMELLELQLKLIKYSYVGKKEDIKASTADKGRISINDYDPTNFDKTEVTITNTNDAEGKLTFTYTLKSKKDTTVTKLVTVVMEGFKK
ncbi:lipoprotein 17-related variable surface protein [Mycoplasma crocodyli]|uniref:MAA2 antigen-like lipoprotein n=1 Tax=Mycoplasma crocodyli (strain ATCC 51981 / MP145) TaxID=512564 RepID=D5E4Z7_MYCCM|nr:lipoprotein 17-related variable surface protein [Mycoplasma crocodyli]ADE19458.1 MAA2 antigen-like lipoprotein [Mycoplasma crocodyli MP145]